MNLDHRVDADTLQQVVAKKWFDEISRAGCSSRIFLENVGQLSEAKTILEQKFRDFIDIRCNDPRFLFPAQFF